MFWEILIICASMICIFGMYFDYLKYKHDSKTYIEEIRIKDIQNF